MTINEAEIEAMLTTSATAEGGPAPVPYDRFKAVWTQFKTEKAARAELAGKVQTYETQAASWNTERQIMGAGITDPDGIAVAQLLHSRLPADKKVEIGEFIRSKPAGLSGFYSAPAVQVQAGGAAPDAAAQAAAAKVAADAKAVADAAAAKAKGLPNVDTGVTPSAGTTPAADRTALREAIRKGQGAGGGLIGDVSGYAAQREATLARLGIAVPTKK